jgi:positive phototaxis protein PixI
MGVNMSSVPSPQTEPSAPVQRTKRGEQFLQFQLFPDVTALMNVQQIAEILSMPVGQVIPIPHMPAWVMGVYNWRGEILWVVDLGLLIGLSPLHQQAINRAHYSVIVVHNANPNPGQRQTNQVLGRQTLGVAVGQVEGMEWCDPDQIQSPPGYAVTPELAPFLRGYLMKANGDMFVTLDGAAILARMPQTNASTL